MLTLRLLVTKIVDRDIRSAFEGVARERPDAIVITAASFLADHRPQIVELARALLQFPPSTRTIRASRVGGLSVMELTSLLYLMNFVYL